VMEKALKKLLLLKPLKLQMLNKYFSSHRKNPAEAGFLLAVCISVLYY
jgi:hypothetical protein